MINCSSKDLEFIDPYEFVNTDFDQIGDLPTIVDEDQEVTEPEVGEVANSEETQAIINEVMDLGESGEVSAATKAKLEEVETFIEQLPPAVNTAAQNLDAEAINNILDPSVELSSDLQAVRDALSLPASVRQLLPVINFSTDFRISSSANKSAVVYDINDSDIRSQSVSGPCADAARLSYEIKIEDLEAQRDANLAIVDGNYTRRLGEADTRYEQRLVEQEERLATNTADITTVLVDLLAAADAAAAAGNFELEAQIRQLTLLYAIDARASLIEWNNLVLELLEDTMAEEKAWAEERKTLRTAEVTAAFDAAKAQANTLLTSALNSCHNQGSGN
ncbi:hypothetical protein LZ575_12715 [Antarcticibacterium sp. 1MA-6-2]|uniref:hypothetical protein n=1 Tax=Antarcticibacterium sp. 1MA-6-2 TaxID=2908210 RepID=UPI001F173AA5|nr:hypothetical protein [Antarcticibacterium sp. 1MA-6-2]UJH89862.1 hypothetical protein LZ575_12715 [Antarcticibacterium sp. 1MA-6-2]